MKPSLRALWKARRISGYDRYRMQVLTDRRSPKIKGTGAMNTKNDPPTQHLLKPGTSGETL